MGQGTSTVSCLRQIEQLPDRTIVVIALEASIDPLLVPLFLRVKPQLPTDSN